MNRKLLISVPISLFSLSLISPLTYASGGGTYQPQTLDDNHDVKTKMYHVKYGDTLKKIAKKNHTSVKDIVNLNTDEIHNINIIKAGHSLQVPLSDKDDVQDIATIDKQGNVIKKEQAPSLSDSEKDVVSNSETGNSTLNNNEDSGSSEQASDSSDDSTKSNDDSKSTSEDKPSTKDASHNYNRNDGKMSADDVKKLPLEHGVYKAKSVEK